MPPSTQSDEVRALQTENQSLTPEIAQLRVENAKQAQLISRYEDVHGHLFSSFSKLPAEIRERIWQLTLSPRFVSVIDISGYVFRHEHDGERSCRWVADGDTRAPVISRVCRESRGVFLWEYFVIGPTTESITKLMQLHNTRVKLSDMSKLGRPVYVNPVIDTVHLGINLYQEQDLKFYAQELASHIHANLTSQGKVGGTRKWGIRNLALEDDWIGWLENNPERLAIFEEFKALEELVWLNLEAYDRLADEVWQSGTIGFPTNEFDYKCWEAAMESIGWLKDWAREDGREYAKWASLKVVHCLKMPAAAMAKGKDCTVDGRGGYDIFGPANFRSESVLTNPSQHGILAPFHRRMNDIYDGERSDG